MPTTIDSLELQVKNSSSDAVNGIDSLAASLGKLKTATKGGIGLTSVIKGLKGVDEAINDESLSKVSRFADAMEKLSALGNLKISKTIADQIGKIGQAVGALPETQKLHDTVSEIERLNALGSVKVPNVGKTALNGSTSPSMTSSVGSDSSKTTDGIKQYTRSGEEAIDTTSRFKALLSSLGGVFKKTGAESADSFIKHTSEVDLLKMKLDEAKAKLTSLLSADNRNNTAIANTTSQIKRLQEELKKAKKESSLLHKALSKLGGVAKKAGGFVGGIFQSIGQRTFGNIGSKVKGLTTQFGTLFRSLTRIATYRAIRFFFSQLTAAMKEGINNLYQYSNVMGGTFAGSMDRLATSFQYLKNSLGAMVSPIINALAPAVDFLIDKFVTLLNVVNQFFARLTGASTFTAAKKQATSYGGAISSAGGAAKKAAKEIKDATLGIDELNIISQPDDDTSSGGGGGGGGGADYGNMFQELPIDNSISDFVDKLKAAFEAGDWKELGTLLGNKFNEIVDSIDWSGIGHKIGYGINGAVQTAYWFLKTADFKNLGNRVAELLNSALSEIEFTYVGRLWVRGFTAALDLFIGFLGGIDWKQLGTKVGDFLRGAFDEAAEWITSIDWGKMADTFYTNLKDFITGIDFASVAESFFHFLGAAIGAAVSFIATIVADIWADINSYFQQYLTNDDGTKKTGIDWVEGLLQGIWDAIKGVGTWIYDHVFKPIVDGFCEAFGIHSPSTVMIEYGKMIVEGLYQGIKNFISSGIKIVKEWATKVFNWFTGGDGKGNIFQKFGNAAKEIVDSFGQKISGVYTTVKSKITTWASGVYNWFTGGDGNGTIFEKFKNAAGNIISGFKDKVSTTYTTVKSSVTTWAGKVKEWFTSSSFGGVNMTTFSTFANNTIEGFKTKIGNAYTNVKSNITTWASKVKEWFTSSSFGGVNFSNFSTFANNTIEGFKTKIGSAYTNVKTNITTWASKTKEWFTSSSFGGVNFNTFSTFANNTIEGFETKIGSAYTNVKTNITTWASKVKEWFTSSSFGGVNNSNWQTFANNVITGFKDKIGSVYTNTKSNITTWASNVRDWFTSSSHGGVNNSNWQTYANNIITGFKDKIGNVYTNTKSNITTWASNVKSWFSSIASSFAFSGFANDVINGFKDKIGSAYTNAKSNMQTFGSSVKSWFTDYCSYSSFYSVASDVIYGFKNGIGNLYSTCKNTISSWGSSIISWFKDKLDSNSPSKVFMRIGEDSVLGYNIGLSDEGKKTKDIVNKWANSFTGIQPQFAYAFAVDTSALDYYDSDDYVKSLQSNVNTRNTFTATGFKEGMEEFYKEYVEPTINRMADDVRRQADKQEKTVVQIGNKTISDAVTTQRNADGYSFVK